MRPAVAATRSSSSASGPTSSDTSRLLPALPRSLRWTLRKLYFLPSDLIERVLSSRDEKACEYPCPFDDETFDLAVLASVFTTCCLTTCGTTSPRVAQVLKRAAYAVPVTTSWTPNRSAP